MLCCQSAIQPNMHLKFEVMRHVTEDSVFCRRQKSGGEIEIRAGDFFLSRLARHTQNSNLPAERSALPQYFTVNGSIALPTVHNAIILYHGGL